MTSDESRRDAACLTCHAELAGHYGSTAHALTSQPATAATVPGTLTLPRNQLVIRTAGAESPGLTFFVERAASGLAQRSVRGVAGATEEHREPMDEIIGSGVRGQSYLTWRGDQLYELPVSWWREGNRWINSPGFPDGSAQWDRAAISRCIECHADSIQPVSEAVRNNRFVRDSLQHGIGCARCHGDGTAHIAAEQKAAGSGLKMAAQSLITNPHGFTRDRQVELCALCHSGQRLQLAPAFTYRAGDDLGRYLQPADLETATPDVHGNQVGLLQKSRCYIASPAISCSTCHQVHAPEKPVASYASRCLTCHQVQQCGRFTALGEAIRTRCIDCHMPLQTTKSIVSVTAGERITTQLRTHWIRVYAERRDLP